MPHPTTRRSGRRAGPCGVAVVAALVAGALVGGSGLVGCSKVASDVGTSRSAVAPVGASGAGSITPSATPTSTRTTTAGPTSAGASSTMSSTTSSTTASASEGAGALTVSQPAAHGSGATWTHFGSLTVAGTIAPAPVVGTTVEVRRNGQPVGTSTSRADGSFTATVSNTSEVGSFTYQARAGNSTTQAVVVQNRAPSVSVSVTATIDAVASGKVTVSTEPGGISAALQVDSAQGAGGSWTTTSTSATSTTATGGSVTASFDTGIGELRAYRLRAQATAPDGTVMTSAVATTRRVAMLDAVVRDTTAADVQYTWHSGCPVGPSQLSTITMNYIGFDQRVHTGGVMIVDRTLASRVVAAFGEGMAAGFPIKQMVNPNHWHGDDNAMMAADNTSGFNCRAVAGQTSWSHHAYGRAVDINTWENPYIESDGTVHGSPAYVTNRPAAVPGLLTASSAMTRALTSRGATWLAHTDWQHFQW